MTPFEASCARIRQEAHAIASDMNLISMVSNSLDLSKYDLRQSEKELRRAADAIAEICNSQHEPN